jgi:peptidoglycan hydrolase CwlO-like protein
MESGAIELKEREKEKKMGAVEELLNFNFFSSVFWKINELDSELQSIEKKLNASPAMARLSSLEKSLQETEKKIQENGFSLEVVNGKIETVNEEIASIKDNIGSLLVEVHPKASLK